MTLEEKLQGIETPSIPEMERGTAGTIGEFWEKFIKPRLPQKEIMEKWFELLKDYTESDNPVFAIRNFSNPEKTYKSKEQLQELRRGFYNTTDAGYSFFYTDNYFAAYFEKMAIDGFVPKLNEFAEMLKNRTFPARFGSCSAWERKKAAYDIVGKNGRDPGFRSAGYKIAHIVDCGKDYQCGNNCWGIAKICMDYFPRGGYDDWTEIQEGEQKYYVRHLSNRPQEAKEILIAHFLRFACPLNYFLTPKAPKKKDKIVYVRCDKGIKDISEDDALQEYIMLQFLKLYGDVYVEYLSLLKYSNELLFKTKEERAQIEEELASIEIGIEYGPMQIQHEEQEQHEVKKMQGIPKRREKTNKVSKDSKKTLTKYTICWDNEVIAESIPMRAIGIRVMKFLTESENQAKLGTFQLSDEAFNKIANCVTVAGWKLLANEAKYLKYLERKEKTRRERYYPTPIKWNNQNYYATNQWVVKNLNLIIEIIQEVTGGRMTIC